MIYSCAFAIALLFLQMGEPAKDAEQMRREASEAAEKYREDALRLNDLAGHIRTESDAESLVDDIAKLFKDELPPPWATRKARRRVARAEYRAVLNPEQLISEDRIVSLWNEYARAIGTSDEAVVTATEVHTLRDLEYASSKFMWSQGWNLSIWTMPDIYTLGPDGRVAHSCRALEALRVFYDLDYRPEYLRSTRQALEKGVSFSDEMLRPYKWESRLEAGPQGALSLTIMSLNDFPAHAAEDRYIREHGSRAMYSLLKRLLDQFLPE